MFKPGLNEIESESFVRFRVDSRGYSSQLTNDFPHDQRRGVNVDFAQRLAGVTDGQFEQLGRHVTIRADLNEIVSP